MSIGYFRGRTYVGSMLVDSTNMFYLVAVPSDSNIYFSKIVSSSFKVDEIVVHLHYLFAKYHAFMT